MRKPIVYTVVVVVVILGFFGFRAYQANHSADTLVFKDSNNTTTQTQTKTTPTNSDPKVPPQKTPEPVKTPVASHFVDHGDVPFTAQAPTGNWSDERQQDGCEEATSLMAYYWVKGKSLSSSEALQQILAISDFEQNKYGEFRDISLQDVSAWIFNDYFNYTKIQIKKSVTIASIVTELEAGHIVLAQFNGQKLGNPYYSGAGPERHMMLIRGYDPATQEFITNDPGTKHGQAYRYDQNVLFNAIMAYPTGHHVPVTVIKKDVIVVSK